MLLRRFVCALSVLVATCLLMEHPCGATEVGRSRVFGIGVAAGIPSSVVGKYHLPGGTAWDFGVGFWRSRFRCVSNVCRGANSITVHGDYLWQERIIRGGPVTLDWHIGAGGRVWTGNSTFAVAARMPIGLDMMFRRPNFIEAFVEIAPAFYVVPGAALEFEGQLGVRFYP